MAILWVARVSSVVIRGSVGLEHLFSALRKPSNGVNEKVTQAQQESARTSGRAGAEPTTRAAGWQ